MNGSPHDSSDTEFTLPLAQQQFVNIMGNLASDDKPLMIEWLKQNWLNDAASFNMDDSREELLKTIASEIRDNLPPEAILPSENISIMSATDPTHSVTIDSFLYDDEDIDDLSDVGKLDRNFCLNCGSHKTQPLNFISHSLSREQIAYLFTGLLPPLSSNHSILDVGSRLGVVLYGAFLYTKSSRIIGIEINADLCTMQQNIIKKFGFQDRVAVIEGNIFHREDLLHSANVIIFNNVFQCFMTPQMQVDMWKYMKQTIKAGTVIVSSPALDKVFAMDQTGIVLSTWVEELQPHNQESADSYSTKDLPELKAYRVA